MEHGTSSQRAEAALKAEFDFMRLISRGRELNPLEVSAATSRNILHEDLGYFGEASNVYQLNEETRDRLIAHTRQDSAHALLNTMAIGAELSKFRRGQGRFGKNISAFILGVVLTLVIEFLSTRYGLELPI